MVKQVSTCSSIVPFRIQFFLASRLFLEISSNFKYYFGFVIEEMFELIDLL